MGKNTLKNAKNYRFCLIDTINLMLSALGDNKPIDWEVRRKFPEIPSLDPDTFDPYAWPRDDLNLTIAFADNPYAAELSKTCCEVYWEQFELRDLYRENGGDKFYEDLKNTDGVIGRIN